MTRDTIPSNLMLFGCDLSRDRKTSELNFWHDLSAYLSEDYEEVIIVSINNRNVRKEHIPPNITIYNLRPVYWKNDGDWTDKEYTGPHYHKLPLSIIYKTITLLRYLAFIQGIAESHNVGVIHYVRIFGVFNKMLKRRLSHVSFTMTVPTHVDRGFPFHSIYHIIKKLGFAGMDKLIATTEATAVRLNALGIDANKIEVIPWSAESETVMAECDTDFRKSLAIESGRKIILWSGPLQGTGRKEIEYAIQVACLVASKTNNYQFVFAFKPDTLRAEYLESLKQNKYIIFLETDQVHFNELQNMSVLFLSPICDMNRTVAPPLTWIEMMQRGVPIVTTPVDGVKEILENNVSGIVASSVEETAKMIVKISNEQLIMMRESAKRIIDEKYNIESIARKYSALWAKEMIRSKSKIAIE